MIEIDVNKADAMQNFCNQLKNKLDGAVVVCIGTEKVVADSLGPRVGSLLNENMAFPLFVYGLQGANIHAQNLAQAITVIKGLHPNAPLLVIDAAVGQASQIGKIQLTKGNIAPGSATQKDLGVVGDVSIVGIVADKNMSSFYDNSCEKSILVEKLSQFIAMGISIATKSNKV